MYKVEYHEILHVVFFSKIIINVNVFFFFKIKWLIEKREKDR